MAGLPPGDVHDPVHNVRMGIRYLARMVDLFDDVDLGAGGLQLRPHPAQLLPERDRRGPRLDVGLRAQGPARGAPDPSRRCCVPRRSSPTRCSRLTLHAPKTTQPAALRPDGRAPSSPPCAPCGPPAASRPSSTRWPTAPRTTPAPRDASWPSAGPTATTGRSSRPPRCAASATARCSWTCRRSGTTTTCWRSSGSGGAGARWPSPTSPGCASASPSSGTVRELAASYFEDYFNLRGEKTLRNYSVPFDLSRLDALDWTFRDEHLREIAGRLDGSRHHRLLTPAMERGLRRVDPRSLQAGMVGTDMAGVHAGP